MTVLLKSTKNQRSREICTCASVIMSLANQVPSSGQSSLRTSALQSARISSKVLFCSCRNANMHRVSDNQMSSWAVTDYARCRYPVQTLYTTYSKADDKALGKGVRLTQCPRCKRFADKYVEHDLVVLFIDLVLIKPQVSAAML